MKRTISIFQAMESRWKYGSIQLDEKRFEKWMTEHGFANVDNMDSEEAYEAVLMFFDYTNVRFKNIFSYNKENFIYQHRR